MGETVGIAIIARNAEKTIKKCIQSFANEVDQVVVVLAGQSTDKTARMAKKASPKVELYDFEWIDDFAAARNYSFSKLHTDWYMWVDSDDTVEGAQNLRQLIEKAPHDVGGIWFPYYYAIDEFHNVTTLYERERLLRATCGWIWNGRLHETVAPLNPCKFVRSEEVLIVHNHLAGQPRNERNFKHLQLMYNEDPENKRVWLYFGHQYFASRNWAEACKWYLKFGTDLGSAPIERFQALCYCSKAMREMSDKQAIDVALMAVELYPNYRDGYLELAQSYLRMGDLDKCIHWAMISDTKDLIQEPPHIIFINPLEYTFNRLVMLSEAHFKKYQLEKAREYMTEAYNIRPTEDIRNHLLYLRELERQQFIDQSIKALSVELIENKEFIKLRHLQDAIPYWYRDFPQYKLFESGVDKYSEKIVDKPEIIETDNGVMVNLGTSLEPEKLLEKLEEKYERITLVSSTPIEQSNQFQTLSLHDFEKLITSKEGRHFVNLRREEGKIICEYDKNIPQNLHIRMYLGPGLEYWNPQTINELGCGGSETSAALISKELAQQGCLPIIYAMDKQIWDGVIYRHHSDFKPSSIDTHLFISSRQPHIFNDDIPAKQKWLWMHDIHCREFLTPEIASQLDCIVALSHWHAGHIKRTYPFLKDCEVIDMDKHKVTYEDLWTPNVFYPEAQASKLPKIAIIGDALDTTRFESLTEQRIPHRFIWCSSPDRGLEEVLNLWPLIKEKLPDATLKIFYGWEYFDSTLWIPQQRELKEKIRQLIQQDGIEWSGRIGQNQIALELMKSDAMLYPPPHQFRETYGIAFLEAQAAGIICFYRENGALGETISDRGIPLKMDATPQDIVDTIASTLNSPSDIIRERARMYALQRTWAKQAGKFLTLYKMIEGEDGQNNSH